ncbi:MAG: prepilin peptidase [Paracoccaceae bacterium]
MLAPLVFLPFVIAIGIWVSWSDMKFMKIPNKAVLALAAVWLVVGLFIVPFDQWLWGLALGAAVLVVSFLATMAGLIGAGDAKFAAAMAPFFIAADPRYVMALFAACLLGAFFSHRALRMVPPFRAVTSDWVSWTNKDFPMGLALSGTLIFYLLIEFLIRFTES